ncbi:MAG: RNA methyltransferase [Bacilli bacterium]|nr:RNA methyltransferase [Bacilli bacterium]
MIESLNNEKIKYYTKLNDKKYRKSEKLFIAAGEHLVTEALKKNIVKEILLLNGEENVYGDVTYVTSDILKKVSDLTNYPKVLAICYIKDDLKIEGNVVALDNIKDPGNLGTIIRSAVAFNYGTILLSEECVDVYNSKVVRATEGMLFNVNIVTCDLFSTLLKLKESGYKIYGTDVVNGESPAYESNKHVLIIGSEARGMSNSIREICDKNLYIKMNDKCESLNAGVSASILMYELGETR